MTATVIPFPTKPRDFTRDEAVAAIKAALKDRSDRAWSVKVGRGTTWGWITVIAPPRRCWHGSMVVDDRAELARLFGLDTVHDQGISIPAQRDYYTEHVDRAEGRNPSVRGVPTWD